MMTLELTLVGQVLKNNIFNTVVSDSEKYLKCKIAMPEGWIGGTINAYFKNSNKTKGELIGVDAEGVCDVPNAYIKAPGFYVSYTCKINEIFIPTTELWVEVKKSGLTEELLPTPAVEENQFSKFQQMYEEVMGATVEGVAGKSAYQVAVDNGYTGTEVEWLESLKGERGLQGEQGLKGDTGIQGVKGDTGLQGPKGDTGTSGAAGLSAYQIWLGLGNTGTEQEFIEILKGAQGILDNTSSGTVSKELVRNTAIKISTALTSLTLTYPVTYYWYDTFTVIFKSAAVTLPAGVVWHDGTAPTIDGNKWYELSIRDNRAVLSGGVA